MMSEQEKTKSKQKSKERTETNGMEDATCGTGRQDGQFEGGQRIGGV